MARQLCPHCNDYCLSFWSKTALGPARKMPCASCRKMVSVPWLQSTIHFLALGLIPLLIVLAVITIVGNTGLALVLALVGVIIGSAFEIWLYYRLVPLVARAA